MNKNYRYTLGVCLSWLVVVGVIALIRNMPDISQAVISQPQIVAPAPVTYTQDPSILSLANDLGIDVSRLNLLVGDNPDLQGEDASYNGYDKIYINPGHTVEQDRTNLAHEFMHYIWYQKFSQSDRDNFKASMLKEYDMPPMYDRMQPYRDHGADETTIVSEVYAIRCTERLEGLDYPAEFEAACNEWLPNRSILFAQAQ